MSVPVLPRDGDKAPIAPKIFGAGGYKYPQLDKSVFIVGNCFRDGAIRMFSQAGCKAAPRLEDAELVVFLGGEDINPFIYGEKALSQTYFNAERDKRDIDAFELALQHDIPMFGICRGMQLLGALNGCRLWQHVENHAGRNHTITDIKTGEVIEVSSMHHQMVVENNTTIPLAYATKDGHSGIYHRDCGELLSPVHKDLEAAIFPDINAVCVQGHPEVEGTPRYRALCLEQIKFFTDQKLIGDNWVSRDQLPNFMKVDV
jgi:GMP synthase-like glutamine amidotransferase